MSFVSYVVNQNLTALPYFQEAEILNPNYPETLVALTKIYAIQNRFDLVSEFKTRLKVIQDGGRNESYFKQ